MKLRPDELRLRGAWHQADGRVEADATARRIDDLVQEHLVRVASSASGWDVLYRDPDDGRHWELTYPRSGAQGGGPPTLVCLNPAAARAKYGQAAVDG